MARENSGWGYDRIVGALSNLGYTVSDQTEGNVLKGHGLALALIYSKRPRAGAGEPPYFFFGNSASGFTSLL
jgi:hypothetical protein